MSMKVKVISDKSVKKLHKELSEVEAKLWSLNRIRQFGAFVCCITIAWIMLFVYWYCQNSFSYFIKHFSWKTELPYMAIILVTLISVIICNIQFIKQVNLVDLFDSKKSELLYLKELCNELKTITDFQYIEKENDKIKIYHLTNHILCCIILNNKVVKMGKVTRDDTSLIVNLDVHSIYSIGE